MPVRARTRMACSISEALRIEIAQTRAITREEWFLPELQAQLERLFDATAHGGEAYEREMDKVREVLPDLKAEQPTAVQAKARAEYVVGELRRHLDDDDLSALRACRMPADAKLGLVNLIARSAYTADCMSKAQVMLPWPGSATARFFILKVWRGLWWAQKGGLDSANEHLLHNDGYDDEYVLVGSFVDGVLSAERRVKEANADLMGIAALDSANTIAAAFDKYKARSRNPQKRD